MRLIDRVHNAQNQSGENTSEREMLNFLEQLISVAAPKEEDEDLFLEWFFNEREGQIERLRSEGLNAMATAEDNKLRSLKRLRKYHSFDGAILRPGDPCYYDDRDHPNWDRGGDVLAFNAAKRVYTVRFGKRSSPIELTVDQIWPDQFDIRGYLYN